MREQAVVVSDMRVTTSFEVTGTDQNYYYTAIFTPSAPTRPTLTISNTDSPDPVVSGGDITYTINYGNTGGRQPVVW